jgi:hypothetical protein
MKLSHKICFSVLTLLGVLAHTGVGYTEDFRKETNHDGLEFSPASDSETDYKDRIPGEPSQGVMDDPTELIRYPLPPAHSSNI